MGFDPERHAALGEQLSALLDRQSSSHPDSSSGLANPAPPLGGDATEPKANPGAEEITLAVDSMKTDTEEANTTTTSGGDRHLLPPGVLRGGRAGTGP